MNSSEALATPGRDFDDLYLDDSVWSAESASAAASAAADASGAPPVRSDDPLAGFPDGPALEAPGAADGAALPSPDGPPLPSAGDPPLPSASSTPEFDAYAAEWPGMRKTEPPPDAQAIHEAFRALTPERFGGFSSAGFDDVGNGQRVAILAGGAHRFVREWGAWISWDGHRYVLDKAALAITHVAKRIRGLLWIAAAEASGEHREQLERWAKKSGEHRHVTAAVQLARSEPGVAVSFRELDADPLALNTLSGVVDFRTGRLSPPDPSRLVTKIAGAPYDPKAEAPRFRRFLAEVLPDPEVQHFLQVAAGMSATGATRDRVLLVLWGAGRNGKSVLVRILLEVLGEYAASPLPSILLEAEGERHPTEIADLFGVRFAACSEVKAEARFNVETVKRLTGNDRLRARRMREDSWEFDPSHHLWLAVNHRPQVDDDTDSTWDRMRLIPFTVRVRTEAEAREIPDLPGPVEDPSLLEHLRAEAPGILRWIVEGAFMYLDAGLPCPAAVRAATAQYRDEANPLADFLADQCITGPDLWVSAADLARAYDRWAEANSMRPLGSKGGLSLRRWRRWLEAAGARSDRGRDAGKLARMWRGIGLADQGRLL